MKRTRTLSDEGQRLYLNGMGLPKPSRKSIQSFLFSCFHSDYDDRLWQVVHSCREATKSLYPLLIDNKNISKRLDAGITNTTRLILSNDDKKVSLHTIKQNVRFFLNVMEKAFIQSDHQTAMMIYIALRHSSVSRLKFKKPKKMKELFEKIEDSYGKDSDCYKKHIHETIRQNEINYLPSLIAASMYIGKNNIYKKAYKNMGHHLNEDIINQLEETIDLYSYINFRSRYCIDLYDEKQISSKHLYDLSEKIQPKKKPSLQRTKKQIRWTKNKFYGKEFVKNNRNN